MSLAAPVPLRAGPPPPGGWAALTVFAATETQPLADNRGPLEAAGAGPRQPDTPAPNADATGAAQAHFETLVQAHYRALYQFAYSLTRNEADAADLTQQTFYIWAARGSQLRDTSKAKAWLFQTLRREFLQGRRRIVRFPQLSLEETESELPEVLVQPGRQHDAESVLRALEALPETFQAPLMLFYLGDFAYQEIAAILEVPLGTVKSRLARGIDQLQKQLAPPSLPNSGSSSAPS